MTSLQGNLYFWPDSLDTARPRSKGRSRPGTNLPGYFRRSFAPPTRVKGALQFYVNADEELPDVPRLSRIRNRSKIRVFQFGWNGPVRLCLYRVALNQPLT